MNLIPVLYFYTPEDHNAFMDEVEFLGDSQLYSNQMVTMHIGS